MGQNFFATISAPKIGSPLLLLLLSPRMLREGAGCADVRCLGQSGGGEAVQLLTALPCYKTRHLTSIYKARCFLQMYIG